MSSSPAEPLRAQLTAICDRLLPAGCVTPVEREALLTELEHALETSKLESLAEFAAGAGHEINNPVATIAGRAQLLLGGETDPERRHALEIIGGQALRIRDMIGDVMLFGRPPAPRIEQLNLREIVQQSARSQAILQLERTANVLVEIPSDTIIGGDRTQLLVLFSSLIRNSLEAADRPGINVRITSRSELQADVTWTVITIADDGLGIPAEIREHLFDPFFSGRQAGRGLGFGLSKCWRIVKLHGGEIFAKPSLEGGAAFELWWPPQRS